MQMLVYGLAVERILGRAARGADALLSSSGVGISFPLGRRPRQRAVALVQQKIEQLCGGGRDRTENWAPDFAACHGWRPVSPPVETQAWMTLCHDMFIFSTLLTSADFGLWQEVLTA